MFPYLEVNIKYIYSEKPLTPKKFKRVENKAPLKLKQYFVNYDEEHHLVYNDESQIIVIEQ